MKSLIRIHLTIFLFLSALTAYAQYSPVTLGIKGGVNVSNFGNDGIKDSDAKIGFIAGITFDYNFDELLFIRSGLDFATKGGKQKENGVEVTYNPMYIQLPLHVGYKLPFTNYFGCLLHVGPYFSYGVDGKIKTKVTNTEVGMVTEEIDFFGSKEKGGFKKFDFGLGLGVGAEFGNMGLELGYDLGLTNISHSNNKEDKVKNLNAYLTLGYRF